MFPLVHVVISDTLRCGLVRQERRDDTELFRMFDEFLDKDPLFVFGPIDETGAGSVERCRIQYFVVRIVVKIVDRTV